jgi:hypothetical protein
MHFYVNDAIFNELKATIKLENQNLVRQQNIYRRRFGENLIQISLLLFERECFEVTQLQQIIPDNRIEISE